MAKLFCIAALVIIAIARSDACGDSCGDSCCDCVDPTVPLNRWSNAITGDNLYTIDDSSAKQTELTNDGYTRDGTAGNVFASAIAGTVPLFHYFDGVDNFYTTNITELLGGKGGYSFIGIEAYIYPNTTSDTVPLYRYYNPCNGDNLYTIDFTELGSGGNGYKLKGVAGYVLAMPQEQEQTTTALYHWFYDGRKDDLYTIDNSAAARQRIIQRGYVEGVPKIVGYCYPEPTCGTVPLYYYYNCDLRDSFYTTNYYGEYGPGQDGYEIMGITCYIYPNATDNTVPLHRYYSDVDTNHRYNTDNLVALDGTYAYQLIAGYIFKNEFDNENRCCSINENSPTF